MFQEPYPITLLQLPTASDDVLVPLHDLHNRVNAERFPADPPVNNLPMLRGNHDIGFKIISEDPWWEIPLERGE